MRRISPEVVPALPVSRNDPVQGSKSGRGALRESPDGLHAVGVPTPAVETLPNAAGQGDIRAQGRRAAEAARPASRSRL
jgi:hypothetical protein